MFVCGYLRLKDLEHSHTSSTAQWEPEARSKLQDSKHQLDSFDHAMSSWEAGTYKARSEKY